MRRELAAIYDELLRRQAEGEKSVFLSGESLELLRRAASEAAAADPSPAEEQAAPGRTPQKAAAAPEPAPRKASAPRKAVSRPAIEVPPPPVVSLPEGDKAARWQALKELVEADPWCRSQVKPGKKIVLGVGNLDSPIFYCGEAPGADEEIQGEPFVGPAGQLLTKIIQAMGLERTDVYIGNIMNYRPPMPTPVGNRPPQKEEMAYCLPYLRAQLEIVRPKVIVALGATAMDGLLGPDPKRRITRVRGQWMDFNGIPLLPTFHPSYLLRNQTQATKRLVWEDMLAVMERLGMKISDRQRRFFQK